MLPPPSPALSASNSLDGIDDLDAFLAAQGSLSHFPTPPLKKDLLVEVIDVLEDLARRDDISVDYDHISSVFALEVSLVTDPSPVDIAAIRGVLVRAGLPVVLLAVAFNILAALHTTDDNTKDLGDAPPALRVVAALSLAVSYSCDHTPRAQWWSYHVCDCAWTASRIDKTIMDLLVMLDFRLHFSADEHKLQEARLRLNVDAAHGADKLNERPTDTTEFAANYSLQLLLDGTSSLWQHGQLTPDSCSSPIADDCPLPLKAWVPLL